MLKRIKNIYKLIKVEKKMFKHASNFHRTVSPVEITSACNSHSKKTIQNNTNSKFNWLNLIIGSVLISFFFFCQMPVFFCTFFFYVHSKIDCSSRFRAIIQQCLRPMWCMSSTLPQKQKKKKQESDSKLVKRRQWRHTWLDVLMVKLRIKYLALSQNTSDTFCKKKKKNKKNPRQ